MPDTEIVVHSSGGNLYIDKGTGKIIRIQVECEDYRDHFEHIFQFDLVEYRKFWGEDEPKGYDILDLGYWLKSTGEYLPADEAFRKNARDNFVSLIM